MKVILIKNVEHLGEEGEVKEVASGYARNYLIPRKLAILATPQALAELKKRKEKEEKERQKLMEKAKELKKKLEGLTISIKSKTTEEGHLFGAVDQKIISDKLKEKGYEIEPEKIILDHHLKEIGEYQITLNLFEGVEAKIKVKIEKE